MKNSILILIFITAFNSSSQKINKDSLLTLLKTSKQDTNRVITLNALCIGDKNLSQDSVAKLASQILKLSELLKFEKGISMAYSCYGNFYSKAEKKDSAIMSYKKAIVFSQRANEKGLTLQAYRKVAAINMSISNYPESIAALFSALKLAEELKDKLAIAGVYNSLGNIYYMLKRYSSALESHKKALQLRIELKKDLYISHSYLNIGNVYNDLLKFDSAFYFYNKALEIQRKSGNDLGEAYTLGNIGIILLRQGKYEESLKNLSYQEKILERNKGEEGTMAECLLQISTVYTKLQKYDEAIKYAMRASELCKKYGFNSSLSHAYLALSEVYEKQNKLKEALWYYKEHKTIYDTINNIQNSTAIANLQFKYVSEKEEEIRQIELEKTESEHLAEVKQHRLIIWSVVLGLIFVIVFSFFLYKRYLLTQKQKLIIEQQKGMVEEKQKEILDSIHYAKRIQTALMTNEKYIEKNLNKLNNDGKR